MEPIELNLDNPVFVVYLNVDGYTRQKAEELIQQYNRFLNYDNVTFWIITLRVVIRITAHVTQLHARFNGV